MFAIKRMPEKAVVEDLGKMIAATIGFLDMMMFLLALPMIRFHNEIAAQRSFLKTTFAECFSKIRVTFSHLSIKAITIKFRVKKKRGCRRVFSVFAAKVIILHRRCALVKAVMHIWQSKLRHQSPMMGARQMSLYERL